LRAGALFVLPAPLRIGCPTLRGFRRVGALNLATMFIRHIQNPNLRATNRPCPTDSFVTTAPATSTSSPPVAITAIPCSATRRTATCFASLAVGEGAAATAGCVVGGIGGAALTGGPGALPGCGVGALAALGNPEIQLGIVLVGMYELGAAQGERDATYSAALEQYSAQCQ
jgi:hypothetical protein